MSSPIIKRRPKVALVIETSNAYGRGLLKGVLNYVRENGPWSLHLVEQHWGERPDVTLQNWQGDGVIARIETPVIVASLKGVTLPIVDLSSARLMPELPWYENDYRLIAQAALAHFLERGHKRFAFYGEPRFNWSRWLGEQFVAQVKEAGYACNVFEGLPPKDSGKPEESTAIAAWLKGLEKPVALLACNDFFGRMIIGICREHGVLVPDEIAVMGDDNDEVFCELSEPPLSSVQQNCVRIGYEAASGLDRLMRGEKLGNEGVFVPPIGVVTRQSTDVLAIEDRNVAQVVRYIREHACEAINMKDVLRVFPQSRRLLETKFKRIVGHSPHEDINNVRISLVKRMLIETDLSIEAIAERCGFAYVEYLSVAFKRTTGEPPSVFRQRNRR